MISTIVSELLHAPHGQLAQKIARLGEANLVICIVVAGELRFGALKKANTRLTAQIERLLKFIDVVPLDKPADTIYGDIRAALERKGTPIGNNDMLIAAHALAEDLILVTDNVREFSRVPGLKIENWLRP